MITSAVAALATSVYLASADWHPLWWTTVIAAVATAAACRRAGARAAGWIHAGGLFVPLAFLLVAGRARFPFLAVWLAALLALIVTTPHGVPGGWAFPRRWRLPLIFWAVTLATVWPALVLREANFLPREILIDEGAASSGAGGTPWLMAVWISTTVAADLVGLLWFDWLMRHYYGHGRAFRRDVVWPTAIAVAASFAFAAYQGLVDVSFLSGGQWAAIHRAAGTLVDGNPSGMIAALWAAVFLGFIDHERRRLRALAIGGALIAWAATWASGSRVALAAAVLGTVVTLRHAAPAMSARARTAVRITIAGALAVLLVAAVLGRTESPVSRMRTAWQAAGGSVSYALRYQLWDRNGPYGTAAYHMFLDSPVVGIGRGCFEMLFSDYSFPINKYYVRSPHDNAQNWFRHQLAELGLLGSVGWIGWVVGFGALVLRRPAPAASMSMRAVRGALIALGIVCVVAMPTANIVVAMMFWTLAFWFLSDSADMLAGAAPWENGFDTGRSLAWAWCGAIAFTVLTLAMGETALRPPLRAAKFDWDYIAGMYPPDPQGMRIARKRATAVVAVTGRWLELTYSVNHFDLPANPVYVKIWTDGHIAAASRLTGAAPRTRYVRVPDGEKRIVIETWVNRTLRPRDYGIADTREIGLFVKWAFVDQPPPGATTAG